jgi:hypothetical protein
MAFGEAMSNIILSFFLGSQGIRTFFGKTVNNNYRFLAITLALSGKYRGTKNGPQSLSSFICYILLPYTFMK